MTRETNWERFDKWYAETGWRYVSSREGAYQVWLSALEDIKAHGAVAEVKKHTGALKDMAIIVWTGDQPAEGTKLYRLPEESK